MESRAKKFFFAGLIFCLLISFLGSWQPAHASTLVWYSLAPLSNKIDPVLQESLNRLQPADNITVIVTLRQRADLSRINGSTRLERGQNLIRALKLTANGTQGPVKTLLQTRLDQGRVQKFESLWVINGFSVTATADVIAELAQNPNVLGIAPDELSIVPAFATPEINITNINAPALWNLGYTGQGIVVANMDTGVDVNHPELSTRWRGGTNSWFDPYGQHPTTPIDLNGHGTWTMGVMVGGDAGGTTVGVAPDAQWIAVRIFNDAGSSTATALHQGFQWLLDPDGNPNTDDAPQVVNNSWTLSTSGCNLDFEPDLQTLRAAGILPVFAAGNYGPSSNTSRSPANNPSAFPVGNLNDNNAIYSTSSRGPSSCAGWSGPYPRIVAPGVTIRTTDLFSGYYNPTGTSLSSPHVAGGLALLLSAFPNLSPAEQENALVNSAVDLGVAGPDNSYGYGRMDLLAAYNLLLNPVTATPTSTANTSTNTPVAPTPTNTPVPPTNTFTNTPVSPTSTFTNTPVPPTNTFTATATNTFTNTPVPPTSTFTKTATPTNTYTFTPTNTATATNTFTNTPVPPTSTFTKTATPTNTFTFTPTNTAVATNTFTNTPVPPTSTFTKTATPTNTFTFTPTNTAVAANTFTNTPVPPTNTFTNTPLPPTNTFTATATYTFTNTAVPPTATFTTTSTATATKTSTPQPSNTPTATSTQSSSMQSKVVAPASITSQSGSTSGSLSSLSLLQQTGADDNPAAYVTFQTPGTIYSGYQTFYLPTDVEPALISTMLLQVNFKGPAASTQKWTFSIYDWNKKMWIKLGDTVGITANQWNERTFGISNITRYVSPGREVRIRLQSSNSNGDAKLDYEAIHITYRPVAVAASSIAPAVPERRPGIASGHTDPNP